MTRTLVANLDVEARWAGVALPLRVRRAVSAAGTLMAAAFGQPGDRLWTPEPVAPERIPAIPGAPRVELCSGARPDPDDPRALWWGRPDSVARGVNHRTFAYALARARGIAHDGAALVANLDQLDAHLAAWRPSGTWVLKAPLSASARDRLRHRGHPLTGEHRTYAQRLLTRSDVCLVEPWVDRLADFGVTEHGVHRLVVDPAGVFRGVAIGEPLHQPALEGTYAAARDALARAGYAGPAGIDAYTWRDGAGRERLHPLSEINARHTFAHVAHALAARVRSALELAPGPVSLRIAAGAPGVPPAGARRIVPLLQPGDADSTCAWLELTSPPDPAAAVGGHARRQR
jgi:hypothetical protein